MNEITHAAKAISDAGAFYYIIAFILVITSSVIAVIIAMFKSLERQYQRQQELFEQIIKQSLEKIPITLESFSKALQEEYSTFETKQKDIWKGVDEALKGLYNAMIQNRELTTKQLKLITKNTMNGTILSISYELNNIITKNSLSENIEAILDTIRTIVEYEVEKGREFLKGLVGSDNLFLKYAFTQTDKMKEQTIKDLQIVFVETSKELEEITKAYEESDDFEQKIKLLNRKCKKYTDLRNRVKQYVEKEKSNVMQMINEVNE